MKRRLFNLAAAVSLVFMLPSALALSGLWVRSYFVTDELHHQSSDIWGPDHAGWQVDWRIGSCSGGVYVARSVDTWAGSADIPLGRYSYSSYVRRGSGDDGTLEDEFEANGRVLFVRPNWRYLGFRFDRQDETIVGALTYAVVPYWVVVMAFGAPAVLIMRRIMRYRAARSDGLCTRCGYDLRATPERCPECGTPAGGRIAADLPQEIQ